MELKISKYIEVVKDIQINSEEVIILMFSMNTGSLFSVKKEYYKKLVKNRFTEIPIELLNKLIRDKFIISQETDEISQCLDLNDLMIKDLRKLNFTIQPTADCQLGCSYCGQTHANITMDISLFDKIINRISNIINNKPKNFYDTISISWYGGEPILAINKIIDFSKILIDFASKNNLIYESDIITNGVLLNKNNLENLIINAKISSFQITLDGLKDTHDNRRFKKDKAGGSFDDIIENILNIKVNKIFIENNCKILLRINVDKNNYDEIPQLIRFLKELEIQKYLYLNFAPVVDWGGNGASINSLTRKQLAEMEINWILDSIKFGFNIPNLLPYRSPSCMIVNPASEVYDADGYITPCYEMNYTKMYENSNHIIGNLNNIDKIKEVSPLREWHSLLRLGKYPCTRCKYLPVCGGSCPKDWFKKEPACPTYKYNLKDRMVLDFLNIKDKLKELVDNE